MHKQLHPGNTSADLPNHYTKTRLLPDVSTHECRRELQGLKRKIHQRTICTLVQHSTLQNGCLARTTQHSHLSIFVTSLIGAHLPLGTAVPTSPIAHCSARSPSFWRNFDLTCGRSQPTAKQRQIHTCCFAETTQIFPQGWPLSADEGYPTAKSDQNSRSKIDKRSLLTHPQLHATGARFFHFSDNQHSHTSTHVHMSGTEVTWETAKQRSGRA